MTKDMISFKDCSEREAIGASFFRCRKRNYPFAAVTLNRCLSGAQVSGTVLSPIPDTYKDLQLHDLALAQACEAAGRIRVEPRAERTRPFWDRGVFLRS
jgi:hypothetical protein